MSHIKPKPLKAIYFGDAGHARIMKEVSEMKALTFKVNAVLKPLFSKAGLILVDYKLEFGRFQGQLQLGDEITPDGCRIWDEKTKQKLEKIFGWIHSICFSTSLFFLSLSVAFIK